MRIRPIQVIPTALLAGVALTLPLSTPIARATPSRGRTAVTAGRTAVAPGRTVASSDRPAAASSGTPFVTLPTGDKVRLRGTAKKPIVALLPVEATGPGRILITHRLGSDLYVLPAVAEPYLGRFLDPTLFDVTRLRTELLPDGRLPVRFTYHGSNPAVPGVIITSTRSGVATGYISPRSAPAFGRALTARWKADSKAGWPHRDSLFAGVTRLAADLPTTGTAKPAFPMFTLKIKVTGLDGKPLPVGMLALMNVDDSQKYTGLVSIVDGVARVSVPKGDYSALDEDVQYNDSTGRSTIRVNTVSDFQVTGDGQTLAVDERTATGRPSVSVPKKTVPVSQLFEWDRVDALGELGLEVIEGFDSNTTLFVAPSPAPHAGLVNVLENWQLTGPGKVPAYSYDLATFAHRIPVEPRYTFRAADLGTVNAVYYGDAAAGTGAFFRGAAFPTADLDEGDYEPIRLGTRRTEYVGSSGGSPIWDEEVVANPTAVDDPGFVDAVRTIKAGTVQNTAWLRGPLGAGIPTQATYGQCLACRTSKNLELELIPFLDSTPDHAGTVFSSPDGLPISRFRFYQNGRLLTDEDNSFGTEHLAPTVRTTYKAVLDVDRRMQLPNQSTRSQTTLTFSSIKGSGGKLPSFNWFCDLATPTSPCLVLPVLQARVALPTSLNGTLPAKRSTITVTAARIQYATRSPISSATLEIRPAGSDWIPVTLKPVGGGKYSGTIDDTGFAGSTVDVRVGAADKGGSTFAQTVLHAYTVTAP